MSYIKVTPDLLARAAALWDAGKSVRVIGSELSIAVSTLLVWKQDHPALFGPRADRADARLALAARLWAEGKTSDDIAAVIGVNGSRVRQIARENPHLFALRKGGHIKPEGLDAAQLAVAELWNADVPVGVIAERTGIKASTIHGWAKRNRDHFPRRASFGQKRADAAKPVFDSWTDAEVETAIGMVGSHTASQIAAILGRSRSAVLGKLSRMGYSLPRQAVLPRATSLPRAPGAHRRGAERSATGSLPCRQKKAEKPVLEKVQHQSSAALLGGNFQLSGADGIVGKSLTELGHKDCRWPVNAPDRGVSPSGHPVMREGDQEHLFCGQSAMDGKPYCRSHLPYAITSREKQVADHAKAALAKAGQRKSFRTGFRVVGHE